MKMKKIIYVSIGIVIICTLIACVSAYQFGYEAGKDSNNLDVIYNRYLNNILPDNENDFVQINLRNGSYYVYRNCTQNEWLNWFDYVKNDSHYIYWDMTMDSFNEHSIWYKTLNK